jgi:anhydro-N-acetylmuramic acid kinase
MRLIGLMSGTSVDSIDAACVEIDGEPGAYCITLRSYVSQPWEPALRSAILDTCWPDAPLQRVTALNFLVGEAFAEASKIASMEAGWELSTVDAIASHGQTIWHQPTAFSFTGTDLASAGTMQVGEPSVIAARTGCTVIADFRVADMAVGGQGAPLVPFADFALFTNQTETRAVQNIGGIGNVTYLRAGGRLEDVLAFDTGPGNILMDGISRMAIGKDYDENGAIAAQGEVCRPMLLRMLDHPFFDLCPPRTTGREMFGADMAARMLAEGRDLHISDADLLATCTALTVESITGAYRTFLDPISKIECVVLGGGGTHNLTLVAMLQKALSPARVMDHEEFGINGDAKEAVAFALLAYETLHGRPSNVPSATGARASAILGNTTHPPLIPSP